jgi:hypothetical protein
MGAMTVTGAAVGATSLGATSGPEAASAACGTKAAAAIAGVDAIAAQRIYTGEMHSSEVSADIAHIKGSQALAQALAGSNRAGVYAAVHALVYMPHWHIVRLRVVKAGQVLADVGGPDVIAPLSGTLTWKGKRVGGFVMSVQDDAGYVKLVSRFIGVPIDLYRNGSLVMGTLPSAPAGVGDGAHVTIAGRSYQALVLQAQAFPAGPLRAVLFVPTPSANTAAQTCAAVRVAAWGQIATRIAARLAPLSVHYQSLVDILQGTSGGLAFVREGSKRLAGGQGPAMIPRSGTVRYRGRSWPVFSWEAAPSRRVYLLTPPG